MHTIEPELQHSPPRRIRFHLSDKERFGAGCIGLFLLPFFAAGIGGLLYALCLTLTLFLGTTTPGTVLSQRIIDNDEGSDSYRITYRFQVKDRGYVGHDNVEPSHYEAFTEGTPVTVQYFVLTPSIKTILPGVSTTPKEAWILWVWVAIWDGVLGLLVFTALKSARLQRKLAMSGVPIAATVTQKETKSDSDSTSYLLHYAFRPLAHFRGDGSAIVDKRTVPKEEWDQIKEGDSLTVLYLPASPKRHTLYRFCLYKATHR